MVATAAVWLAGLGCGGDPAAPVDAGAEGDAGAPATLFEITLSESRAVGDATGIGFATVYNPFRGDGLWIEAARSGDCVFNQPQPPDFCDPACQLTESCGADGLCHPRVEPMSAGDIEVTGLRSALTLRVEGTYLYYQAEFDPEPVGGELFDPGDEITAAAPGADVAAFEVTSAGVATITTDLPCDPGLTEGSDLALTWAPGGAGDRIRLVLQSSNHGLQFSSIVCETDDDGALTVDADLITAYLADWRPTESWNLSRYRDGVTRAGDVEVRLRAASLTGCTYY